MSRRYRLNPGGDCCSRTPAAVARWERSAVEGRVNVVHCGGWQSKAVVPWCDYLTAAARWWSQHRRVAALDLIRMFGFETSDESPLLATAVVMSGQRGGTRGTYTTSRVLDMASEGVIERHS